MFPFFEYIKIVFIILSVWSIILCYMSTRFLFVIKGARKILRKQDITNSVFSAIFGIFSVSELFFYPQLLERYTSAFIAICTTVLVTLIYFTDYLITSIKRLKS